MDQMDSFEINTNQLHRPTWSRPRLTGAWQRELRRLPWLLLFVAAFVLTQIASMNPEMIEEQYATKFFPAISNVVTAIFGWMPFSFAEYLLYVLIVLLCMYIAHVVFKAVRRTLVLVKLVHTLITFAIVVGIAINAFYVMWGFNYYRMPIAHSMHLDVRDRAPSELVVLCLSLAQNANSLREQVTEDENGVFEPDESITEKFAKIPAAYQSLAKQYPQFDRQIPAPKQVRASKAMSVAGIAGIFIPFTQEPNVNVHQMPLLTLSSAAHECAHQMGIAREDEANFIAYLACIRSSDPCIQYSGVVLALIHAGNELDRISPDTYSALYKEYSPALKRDLAAHREYWDEYEGKAVEETVSKMNDNYLKSHGQSDGVASYGRMVDLLLAYYSDQIEAMLSQTPKS